LLPGFVDFFNDSGSDELAQAWGITFPVLTGESYADVCVNRFDALISRLNKQLIWRLHQERNNYARIYIKDFPLQIERLKEAFVDILSGITRSGESLALKGLYLTSAMQNEMPEQVASYPKTVSADDFQRSMEIMNTFVLRKQAYFIKQFLLQGILQPYSAPAEEFWQNRALVSAAVICMIVLVGGIEGKDKMYSLFHHSSGLEVTTNLAQYPVQTKQEAVLPAQLVASSTPNHKQLANLKTGKISIQRKEDKV
jgi:type VI protein secretion system component VasK